MTSVPASAAVGTEDVPLRSRVLAPRDWPFAWKLRASLLLLVLISAAGITAVMDSVRRTNEVTRTLVGRELAGLRLVLAAGTDAHQAVLALHKADEAAEARDPQGASRWLAVYTENRHETDERLRSYQQLPLSPRQRDLLTEAQPLGARWIREGDGLAAAIARGQATRDPNAMHTRLAVLVRDEDAFRTVLGRMEDAHATGAVGLGDQADADLAAARRTAIACLVILAAAGLLAAWLLARVVTTPVTLVAASANRIAAGDLTGSDVRVRSTDEVGQLARAFNRMHADLRSLIGRIQRTSDTSAGMRVRSPRSPGRHGRPWVT